MIKIGNIKVPVGFTMDDLCLKVAEEIQIPTEKITDITLSRLSIDARKKTDIHYVSTVLISAQNEGKLVSKAKNGNISLYAPKEYVFPEIKRKSTVRPVVVGTGPAGLFAALHLARAGFKPIILERGRKVERRAEDVENFWKTGLLQPSSNVQFGEGGAGTFSDGKLTTGINDPRVSHVLSTFVEYGAPEDILWQHKPHIGTDVLRNVIKSMRQELISLESDLRFEHKLTGLKIKDGKITAVMVDSSEGSYELACDSLVLAPGHSARDTFEMLYNTGIPMDRKSFAIGVRIEHRQSEISHAQYGSFAEALPPADYKLACHLPNGRSAFTFCVCPGGQVIAAASENERLVTNGMSFRAREGKNINGGFLVGIDPKDFGGDDPLSGMRFQEIWENRAYLAGGACFAAPIQTVKDFLTEKVTGRFGRVMPTYSPGVCPANLRKCLPDYVTKTLAGALPVFGRSLRGFDDPEALMTGVETRSSSPVRILRGDDMQSAVRGIYPCGEGAGYAGGITSAAVDGIRVAEMIVLKP